MARPIGSKNIKWDKDELRRLYWDERMHCKYIAERYNTNSFAVREAMVRFGIPRRSKAEMTRGDLNYQWSGGRKLSKGYVLIYRPNHHRANYEGFVREHILVWEETHKRKLYKGEIVHHLNGVRDDNRQENLVAKRRGCHIHLAEPFKKRIRELELEVERLAQALRDNQLIFIN